MMPRLGTHLRQRAGISVTNFYDALNGLWLRQDGPRQGKNKDRLGIDSYACGERNHSSHW